MNITNKDKKLILFQLADDIASAAGCTDFQTRSNLFTYREEFRNYVEEWFSEDDKNKHLTS